MALAGWSMTSDAQHFVAPNLATVTRCIAEAIADAGLQPVDVDAVNAHGTSTRIGDTVEAQALAQIFGHRPPPVSANKSMTGHAMGASSAIETILAIEGMQRGQLLPTINHTPDPDSDLGCRGRGPSFEGTGIRPQKRLWFWRLQRLHRSAAAGMTDRPPALPIRLALRHAARCRKLKAPLDIPP